MSWEENVRKVTPYVPGEQPAGGKLIKLNTNECPYPPSPKVQQAIQNMSYEDLRLYPDPEASLLTRAIGEAYGFPEDQVFVGVGSDDVLSLAFMTFFNSGREILFPDITYSFYDVWAGLHGIPFRKVALDENFQIHPEDYFNAPGGLVIPNPNAPTGLLMGVDQIEEILKHNQESVVIIDEAYIDFGGESCLKLVKDYDNLLVVQTFSKSRAMAGIRIGFAFGGKKLIRFLKDVKFSFNSYTMNRPSLLLGTAAVKDGAYFRECCGRIIATRERTKKELSALGFTFPDSKANFIFARHNKVDGTKLFQQLREKRIFVRHFDAERIGDYLRITVGTDEQMDSLLQALRGLLQEQN